MQCKEYMYRVNRKTFVTVYCYQICFY